MSKYYAYSDDYSAILLEALADRWAEAEGQASEQENDDALPETIRAHALHPPTMSGSTVEDTVAYARREIAQHGDAMLHDSGVGTVRVGRDGKVIGDHVPFAE